MYVILWEYQVRAEHIQEFEEVYSATGAWAKLFQKGKGYLGTELFYDENNPRRYITIDQWGSKQDYEAFLTEWKREYISLDAQCDGLTEMETPLGRWVMLKSG